MKNALIAIALVIASVAGTSAYAQTLQDAGNCPFQSNGTPNSACYNGAA